MFGFDKKPGLKLDPNKLAKIADDQLYLIFSEDNWAKIDKASRIAALQEIENRRAKLDGRPPIRVLEGDRQRFKDPSCLGYYSDKDRVICINYRFLEGDSPYHTSFEALDVVIHEGRHAMQHDVLREHPDRVAEQILNEWRSSNALYFAPPNTGDPQRELRFAMYALQSIEVDARHAARVGLLEAIEVFEANGLDTRAIHAQLNANLSEEYNIIWIVQNTLTLKDIDQLEQLVLEAMRKRYPDVDTSRLHVFDHARMILNSPRIDRIDNPVELIAELDSRLEAMLDKVDKEPLDSLDPPKDKLKDGADTQRFTNL